MAKKRTKKLQTITDVHGEVMYQGLAVSKKDLIEELVRQKHSLDYADLSGLDLRQVDLSGAKLTGANFTKSGLRGANMSNAMVQEACFANAELYGIEARRTRFEGADFTNAKLAGAVLSFSNFRGAKLTGADFSDCNASSTQFTHSHGRGVKFVDTKLKNSDFSFATIQEGHFEGANFETTLSLAEEHLPNRTLGATFVSCRYSSETKFCSSVPALKKDSIWSSIGRLASWIIPAALMYEGMTNLEHLVHFEEMFEASPMNVALIIVFPAAALIKTAVEEFIREKAGGALSDIQLRARKFMADVRRMARSKADLVVAVAKKMDLEPLRLALEASHTDDDRTKIDALYWVLGNDDAAIVCDRRDLGRALAVMSDNETRHYPVRSNVVLINPGAEAHGLEGPPSALRFQKDGSVIALWGQHGKVLAKVKYPAGKNAVGEVIGKGSSADHCLDKKKAIELFRSSILSNDGLMGFNYPRASHYVREGKDGTILVYNARTRRLDNPIGAAVIKLNGEKLHYRNGVLRETLQPETPPNDDTPEVSVASLKFA